MRFIQMCTLCFLVVVFMAACGEDPATVKNGTTVADAIALLPNQSLNGSINNDPYIYYLISLPTNATCTFSLYNLTKDFDLGLYKISETNGAFVPVALSAQIDLNAESITCELFSGVYYLVVSSWVNAHMGSESGTYTVSFDSMTPSNPTTFEYTLGPGFTFITNSYYPNGYHAVPANTTLSISISVMDLDGIDTITLYSWADAGYSSLASTNSGVCTLAFMITNTGFREIRLSTEDTLAKYRTFSIATCYGYYPHTFITNNGDGTRTFLVRPEDFSPSGTSHAIYLAGEMNNWSGTSFGIYSLPNTNCILMTNRGDGIFIAVVSNVSSGMKYKYIVNYDDDATIDSPEWKTDTANPNIISSDNNSVVP